MPVNNSPGAHTRRGDDVVEIAIPHRKTDPLFLVPPKYISAYCAPELILSREIGPDFSSSLIASNPRNLDSRRGI